MAGIITFEREKYLPKIKQTKTIEFPTQVHCNWTIANQDDNKKMPNGS